MNLPLPHAVLYEGPEVGYRNVYTAEQVRQAQREAVASAVPEGYTEDQIAQAACEAEIPDSKLESILIALHGMLAAATEVKP